MAFLDLFDGSAGTDLQNHTSDSGHTYTTHPVVGTGVGELSGDGAAQPSELNSVTLDVINGYSLPIGGSISIDVAFSGTGGFHQASIFFHMSNPGASLSCLRFDRHLNGATHFSRVAKYIGGVFTSILAEGSVASSIKVVRTGATTYDCFRDGVFWISLDSAAQGVPSGESVGLNLFADTLLTRVRATEMRGLDPGSQLFTEWDYQF